MLFSKRITSCLTSMLLSLLLTRCLPSECVIDSDIHHSTTWWAGTRYRLQKPINVLAGATLTVQPGVILEASTGASLHVLPGAKLIAEGSASAPIVFTAGEAAHWKGLHLEGDCGRLKFVRVEFAGLLLENCEQTATFENVQIHRAQEDGLTLRGGNANLRRLVVTRSQRNGVVLENGYHGRIQSLVVQQNTGALALSDREMASFSPMLSNVTLLGAMKTSGNAEIWNLVHLLRSEDVPHSAISTMKVHTSLIWPHTFALAAWPLATFEWRKGNSIANPMLRNPYDAQMPDFTAEFDSPIFTSAIPNEPFFESTENFVGAVGTQNWLQGWTQFETEAKQGDSPER